MLSKVKFWMALSTLAVAFVGLSLATTDELENAVEYGILCNIYRLLEFSPKGPYFAGSEKDGNRVMDTIVYLYNASAVETFQNLSVDERVRAWAHEIGRPSTNKNPGLEKKFGLLLGRAQDVLSDLKRAETEARGGMDRTRQAFAVAIYGSGAKVGEQGPQPGAALSKDDLSVFAANDPGKACGGAAGASAATGTSLVNDFFCLCVGKQNSKKPCSSDVVGHSGASSSNFYQLDSKASIDESWTEMVKHCPVRIGAASVARISAGIALFKGALGRRVQTGSTDTHKLGLYTFGEQEAVATGCTGEANQVCVNYKKHLESGGTGIPWLNKIVEGVREWEGAHRAEREANVTFKELQSLERQARNLYIDAVHGINGSPLIKATNKTPVADKPAFTEATNSEQQQRGRAERNCLITSGLSIGFLLLL